MHTEKYNHVKGTNKGAKRGVKAPHLNFHVYAVEWTPEKIDWFMDGAKTFSFANEKGGPDVWPFDKPQFLILNLAFGGTWGGSRGVDITQLPQTYLVDYVRVYQ